MAQTMKTSITDTAARRFLDTAPERKPLGCKRIPGLRLIKLKGGGSWQFRYTGSDGKRHVATIGSYPTMKPHQAAQKAGDWRNNGVDVLAAKAHAKREHAVATARAKHRTLRAYLEGPYKRHQERKKSGEQTLGTLRHNFADWLDRDMSTLTRADVEEWQAKREADGRAHATLQRAFGSLKTLIRHAMRQDPPLLDENPLERISLERPTDSQRAVELSAERASRRRLLTDGEIQGLHHGLEAFAEEIRTGRRNSRAHGKGYLPDLDAVAYPHWFIPFAYAALYTGMRPGDLYSMTWLEMSVNFKRITKIPEKTRHHPDPARIIMDMPEDLYKIMHAWWKQNGKPEIGLVFPSPVNGERMDKKAHLKAWVRVKRLGELPNDLAFYSLRHHFISSLVAAGVPLLTVAKLAGHKSSAMIEKHYGHLVPDAASRALTAFSRTVRPKKSRASRR